MGNPVIRNSHQLSKLFTYDMDVNVRLCCLWEMSKTLTSFEVNNPVHAISELNILLRGWEILLTSVEGNPVQLDVVCEVCSFKVAVFQQCRLSRARLVSQKDDPDRCTHSALSGGMGVPVGGGVWCIDFDFTRRAHAGTDLCVVTIFWVPQHGSNLCDFCLRSQACGAASVGFG